MNALINDGEIKKLLLHNIKAFIYDETDSTNTEARRLLKNGLTAPFAVISNIQTGGRGRSGKRFFSPACGVYVTCVLPTDENMSDTVHVTSKAAVAVVRAIKKTFGIDTGIKWVNDIYLHGKKLAGILSESVCNDSGKVHSLIIGVGVNYCIDRFPDELADIATSIWGTETERHALIAEIINSMFEILYDPSELYMQEYMSHSIVLEKEIYFIKNGERFDGRAVSIDKNGALHVLTEKGEQILNSGEISLRVK